MNKSLLLPALAASLLGALAIPTLAAPIVVPNYSFEANPVPSNPGYAYVTRPVNNTSILSDWIVNNAPPGSASDASGGQLLSYGFNTPYAPAQGSQEAFLNLDTGITTGFTATIQSAASLAVIAPMTTYTLTVAVGNNLTADTSNYGSVGNVTLSLLGNGIVINSTAIANGTIANGKFVDYTVTFTTGASGGFIGDALTISLADSKTAGAANQGAFDNVRLDATAIPEPGTWSMLFLGAGVLILSVRRRRA